MLSTIPPGSESLNIWITGCSGFLGTRLAVSFASRDHKVIGLSRRKCSSIKHSLSINLASPDTLLTLRDLVSRTGVPDVVIHAAAKQPGSGELPEFIEANVRGTSNLLDALRDFPPRQFIFTSTHSVYGRPSSLPVTELSPAAGSLPYGATKRWAEQFVEVFQNKSKVVILRLPSLFGAGQADSFIDGLARSALRNDPIELFSRGELIRDALHVDDVVKAIDSCVRQPPEKSLALLNLGSGRAIKTLEYAQHLTKALASDSAIIPVDRRAAHFDLYADIAEARKQIAFEPMSLAEAMKTYANELRT